MRAAWQAGGLHQVPLGFIQAFLLLAQNTHAAKRVEVPWVLLKARLQGRFGAGQVAGVERFQGLGHTQVPLPSAPAASVLRKALVHQCTDLRVVRVCLQVLLEQHHLIALGRPQPFKGKAPRFVGIATDIGVVRKRGQGADAVGAAVGVTRQVQGQEQRQDRIVRPLSGQLLQPLTCLRPAILGEPQGVVVLAGNQPLRLTPLKQAAIDRHRLLALIGIAQLPGLLKHELLLRRCQTDVLLQLQGLQRCRRQCPQALQVTVGNRWLVLLYRDQAKAVQGVGVFRGDVQQLLPGLRSPVCLLFVLPVLALLNQQDLGADRLGCRGGGTAQRRPDSDG
ncbi:hypothetical protein D3C81_820600 [compost metagenome]